MKTAIYIEDSVLQLVLTPETEWEKSALEHFHEKSITAKFFNGQFAECRGGYIRQFDLGTGYGRDTAEGASLMIRADAIVNPK